MIMNRTRMGSMEVVRPLVGFACLALALQGLWAHPGSAIAIDRQGQVYFIDTGHGVWKIDREGRLREFHRLAYHWMAFDSEGYFANSHFRDLQNPSEDVQRITPDGARPALIIASDYPITVGPDGNFYHPLYAGGGPLKIIRRTPAGKTAVLASLASALDGSSLRWVNGIAAGPDGSIYVTENSAVRKIRPNGDMSTVVGGIRIAECSTRPVPESPPGPYLRGLAVDSSGAIYVAASGCRCLVRITPDGRTKTLLTAQEPWSPTGVAVLENVVYVLEYTHTPGDNRREWLPRVRKISVDGQVTTLASVERK